MKLTRSKVQQIDLFEPFCLLENLRLLIEKIKTFSTLCLLFW